MTPRRKEKELIADNVTLAAENARLKELLGKKEHAIQNLQLRLDACLYAMVLMQMQVRAFAQK